METKSGSTLLLVVGLLFLASGVVNLTASATGLIAASHWDINAPVAISWGIYYAIALMGSLFYMLVGFIGIAYRKRLKRAPILKAIGIMCICYEIFDIGLIFFVFSDIFNRFTIVFAFVGVALAGLYVVGAQKNLNAYG